MLYPNHAQVISANFASIARPEFRMAMSEEASETCWICREHAATIRVAAVRPSLCTRCEDTVTRPFEQSWNVLARYLHANWKEITKRGNFDLVKVFGAGASAGATQTHLHFVKLLGCKLFADNINVDLSSFSTALTEGRPHADITLLVAHGATEGGKLLYYDTEVSVLKRDDEVYSAVWTSLSPPVAVKTCYLVSSAPVMEPDGFPWHPTRQRKIVKLSPYKGDTRPVHARRDLRM